MAPNLGHASGRAILNGLPVHIADAQADRDYDLQGVVGAGLRSVLAVPMLRGGTAIGTIVLHSWSTPRPFSDSQIALLQTFADQAVIAIQNVRLITTVDVRGTVVGWNPGAVRLFGYTEAEAIGRDVDDLVGTPETREEVRTNVRRPRR